VTCARAALPQNFWRNDSGETTMNPAHANLQQMLAIWNQRDLNKVRAQLEAVLAPEIEFIDPTIVTRGYDEFEANVRHFRGKYPIAEIQQASAIDSHHQVHRYHWAITANGKTMLEGFDVSETNDAGKVTRVLGFFGPVPKL
jgi:hypothetical protein